MQNSFLFYPEKLSNDYKYHFQGEYKEIFINSEKGIINALHFRVANPAGVVLFLHGNAGSLRSWGLQGEDFASLNYDCVIYDYRGYGKSTGKISEALFHKDANAVYEYVKQRYKDTQIVIAGQSIGTGFAARLASEKNPSLLILIAPYYSLTDLAKKYFKYIPVNLILKFRLETFQYLPKVRCPVILFHGTDDEIIPYQQSLKLKKILKPEDEMITIEGGGLTIFPFHQNMLRKWREF